MKSNFKRLISVSLVIIIMLTSLFVVDFNLVRAVSAYDEWDGTKSNSYAGGIGTSDSPYLIETAEQLYKMVVDEGCVGGVGKYFKVADGVRAFYITPDVKANIESGKKADQIIADVKNSSNDFNWNKALNYIYTDKEGGFKGNFDGNGATIYGLKAVAEDRAAFIPVINDLSNVTIKNIAFEYSYVETTTTDSSHATSKGVVTAAVTAWYSTPSSTAANYTINFSNISIKHVRAAVRKDTDIYWHGGALMGWPMHMKVLINDCIVVDVDNNMSALLGNAGNANNINHTLKNCIVVNADALPITNTESTNDNSSLAYSKHYNCYFTGYSQLKNPANGSMVTVATKITESQVTGAAAKSTIGTKFDWINTWFINNGLPELRVFHDIKTKEYPENRESGHIDICEHCGLRGIDITSHSMQTDPTDPNNTVCSVCGYTPVVHKFDVKPYPQDNSLGHIEYCTDCDYEKSVIIPHTMQDDPDNVLKEICIDCGYKVDKHFHTMAYKPAESPIEGHIGYCTDCDYIESEITGHNLQIDPNGEYEEKCIDCGYTVSKHVHTIVYKPNGSGHIGYCISCDYQETSILSHSYTTRVNYADTSSGHIQVCTDCGYTDGTVTAHNLQENSAGTQLICTACQHTRIKNGATWDGSYFAQAVKGINDSEMYRYNLSGIGITNPTGANPYGQNSYVIGKEHAIFSDFQNLTGSGTEADPYIINDALTLYRVLSSSGSNFNAPFYFKLGCDIDLGNKQWLDLDERWIGNSYAAYKYLAWNATLDGDGHTITGLFSSTDDIAAGFIPILGEKGVIKNLHIRNASVASSKSDATVGVIAGIAQLGSQIIGCSVENSGNTPIVGNINTTVINSYAKTDSTDTYYNQNGWQVLADQINVDAYKNVWYKGGKNDSVPYLLGHTLGKEFIDVDGDGISTGYSPADLVALRNHLLRKEAYKNICGDASKNGSTDIRDLAMIRRQMVGDDIDVYDGFWLNAANNKFNIYYTDNDNLDFARKLELYFKESIGVDIVKQKATAPSQYAIVLKKDGTLNVDYIIDYDVENALLTFTGKSFTAVEQAVLDFIEKSDCQKGIVYKTENGILPTEKQSIIRNNREYYYAWGDEFNTGSVVNGNTTVDYSKWEVRDMGSDSSVGSGNTGQYRNLKFADNNGLAELNVVKDGKLTMHRGIGYGAAHIGEKSGILTSTNTAVAYDSNDIATSGVLYTKHSMLFKRGYLEMKCTLPSDGYAFPAWWLMTNAGNNNPEVSRSLYNKVYELNEDYNQAFYYTPDDYTTYKYKLPGATYEIDIFEIIQQPGLSGATATPSTTHKYQYTVHKWYVHSKTVRGNNLPLKVYELDWDNVKANGGFTQIFNATYSGGKYVKDWGTLNCHTGNMEGGQVNADISRNGSMTDKYSRTYLDEYYTADSNKQTTATFGLLWDEEQITQYIYKEGSTTPIIKRIDIADLGYDNVGFDIEQYAYMLMENHLFTNPAGSSTTPQNLQDCTMVVDYVRLYQLDGQRDIVTPETEAFNNPKNRFN